MQLKLLLELFTLEVFLSLHLQEVFLKLLLDLLNSFIHLLLLFYFIVSQLLLNFVKLLSKQLTLLSAGIKSTSEKFILAGLVLFHHIFNALHLVLQFIDHTSNFFAFSALFLENVTHRGTLVMSAVDLLLENGVLLTLEILQRIVRVVLKVLFELLILNDAPIIELLLTCLGISLTLTFLFVLGSHVLVSIITVKTVHVIGGLVVVFIVNTLDNVLVCTKHTLQLCNLAIERLLLDLIFA